MKSVFFKKYETKVKVGRLSQIQFDQFKDYISHYKSGQEETENFLAFYSNNQVRYWSKLIVSCNFFYQVIEMDEEQVEEIVDTEDIFSKFQMFYGDADSFFCYSCNKAHIFSH